MKLIQFLKDTGSNYIIYGLQLLIGIVAVPVYLAAYGDSLYGVYLLSIGLASSFIFLQFGSGQAMLRYVAEYLNDADDDKYGLALRTCGMLSAVSSLMVLSIFIALAFGRSWVFDIPSNYSDEAFWLLLAAGGYAYILFLAQIPQSMLKGAGVFYKRNKLVLVELIARGLLVALVYFYTISIYWLLVGDLAILLLGVVFDFYLLGRLQTSLLRADLIKGTYGRNLLSGEVWHYAKDTFLLSVVSFFSQSSDKLLIALFLDVRFVTIYGIITKPYNVIKSLLSKVFVVLNPQYINILKARGKMPLSNFLAKATKILVVIVAIPVLLFTLFLPEIFELWLGTTMYNEYVIYGQMLLLILVLRSVTSLYNNALFTIGEAKRLLNVRLIVVSANLLVSLALIKFMGVGAVIVGTCVQMILVAPMILRVAEQYFEGSAINMVILPWYFGSLVLSAIAVITVGRYLNDFTVVDETVMLAFSFFGCLLIFLMVVGSKLLIQVLPNSIAKRWSNQDL